MINIRKEIFMKKLFAVILCGVILASSMPVLSLADTVDDISRTAVMPIIKEPVSNAEEPTSEGMEKALLTIKQKITIPDEYSEFNYYFYDTSSYSDAYWRFIWSNPNSNATIQINCDKNYHITYYYKYDYSDRATGIAKYLKSELKSKADEFIRQIAPELKMNYEYLGAEYNGVYSGEYVYYYQRVENKIAFPDNTIQVNINSISGEVTSARINWLYDKSIPSAATKLTKEDAAKLIKENMKMKLVYRNDFVGIYDKNGNRKTKAFLVYEPTSSYISIDAKTGQVYFDSFEWTSGAEVNYSANEEKSMDATADAGPVRLTEKEIAKIQELDELITKEKAIEAVTSNKSLYLDETLKAITASLSKIDSSDGKTSYVWYINMNDPRKVDYSNPNEDYYRAYANAAVDARSGKIISFYASLKSYYNNKENKWESINIKYNKDEARQILEKFLKSQISSKFTNTVLSNSYDDYVVYYDEKSNPVYGGYGFTYNRTNEGIEYPYNSIYGSVEGVTGKIFSYSYYWDDMVEFESAKGVISPEEAMDYYLSNKGFDLKYEIKTVNKLNDIVESNEDYIINQNSYNVDYIVRLVYRPDVTPKYISPFTGEQLNLDGTVYKEKVAYSYDDIKDAVLYRNIFLLADMGVGFEDNSFLPDKAITVGELNKLLSGIGYGYYITVDTNTADTITREKAALTFIKRLGLERMSKLPGIYKTGYDDEALIGNEYIGAVALSKALGLMSGDAYNYFNPKNEISRLDAVSLLINFINVQSAGLY